MDQVLFSHHNEGCELPLVVPVTVESNTKDEQILANVFANSTKHRRWLRPHEARKGVAIICGSGPSLADCIDEIRELRKHGLIFALNGAASYLFEHGIIPDYQVIMDAQPQTIDLVGPARQHLFASMVDPSLFDRVPDAVLWHATYGDVMVDEQEGFPMPDHDYCLIGSGITVGNTSLPLAYAMGYRELHIFGMDSCHRGAEGHVNAQPINDGDPCMTVEFNGKQYVSSFVMKLQADNFIQRANILRTQGCKVEVHGTGYLQDLWRASRELKDEKTKYELMWSMPEYRNSGSPGGASAADFVRIAKPRFDQTVLDLGCGPGLGGQAIKRLCGANIVYVDIASNARAPEPFVVCDMSKDELPKGDFGYSADVMEHIPPEQVDGVLQNILKAAPRVFFRISLLHDIKGVLIGHPLHLSVHPAAWWYDKLSRYAKILMMQDYDEMAYFYVATHGSE
jgi:Protein of unknown function DUF115